MKRLVIWSCILLALLGVLGIAAIHIVRNSEPEEGISLYYLSAEEDQLIPVLYQPEESEVNALAAELYLQQQTLPEDREEELHLLVPEDVKVLNYSVDNELLVLDFSAEYSQMTVEREILVRAGLVRLFTQMSDVRKVQFQVEGEALTGSDGLTVGTMTAGKFVENSGKEINSYLKTTMTLYFADSEENLLSAEERSVYYNSNVPIERVVVEQLVKGTSQEDLSAVLPTDLNILSVTIQDEICYVNLGDNFTTLVESAAGGLDPELAVYAIVNSLADTCKVSKVQISVNGHTDLVVGEVDLSTLLGRREDLILQ